MEVIKAYLRVSSSHSVLSRGGEESRKFPAIAGVIYSRDMFLFPTSTALAALDLHWVKQKNQFRLCFGIFQNFLPEQLSSPVSRLTPLFNLGFFCTFGPVAILCLAYFFQVLPLNLIGVLSKIETQSGPGGNSEELTKGLGTCLELSWPLQKQRSRLCCS